MAQLLSLNLATSAPNPYKRGLTTGIGKQPVRTPVQVRAPGPKHGGLGSGLVGDHVGDRANHGGDDQAVYAFPREDLDDWEERLGRSLPDGFFGENLTTTGLDVNGALLGERWRIGTTVELAVTFPRIPCNTFRGWMGEKGWLRTFSRRSRPGAYLRVVTPGNMSVGDPIEVVWRPEHDVTVALTYAAVTLQRDLQSRLLAAEEFLDDEVRRLISAGEVYRLG